MILSYVRILLIAIDCFPVVIPEELSIDEME